MSRATGTKITAPYTTSTPEPHPVTAIFATRQRIPFPVKHGNHLGVCCWRRPLAGETPAYLLSWTFVCSQRRACRRAALLPTTRLHSTSSSTAARSAPTRNEPTSRSHVVSSSAQLISTALGPSGTAASWTTPLPSTPIRSQRRGPADTARRLSAWDSGPSASSSFARSRECGRSDVNRPAQPTLFCITWPAKPPMCYSLLWRTGLGLILLWIQVFKSRTRRLT